MKISLKHSNILYFIILLMPFVDMITGYALNTGHGGIITSLGQVYRMATFFYVFYLIFAFKIYSKSKWLLPFTAFMFITIIINYIRFQGSIVEDFGYVVKAIFPIYIVYSLMLVSKENPQIIDNIMSSFLWIYPLSFVVPKVLGMGYYSYSNESGYKAFYFANNEVNVILMILFIYSFNEFYNNYLFTKTKFKLRNIVQLLMILVSLLLIGSKTSILAIVIVLFAYLIKKEKFSVKIRFLRSILLISFVGVFIVSVTIAEQIGRSIERIVWYFVHYTGDSENFLKSFITFLCSERNLRVEPSIEYWYQENFFEGILNFFIGIGKSTKSPDATNIWINPFSIIELDFFECLFWFGIISTVIIFIFYLSVFIKSFKVKGLYMQRLAFLMVFMFSMIAGHVLVSTNSGTMFAIVLADLYIKTNRSVKIGKERISYNNFKLQ